MDLSYEERERERERSSSYWLLDLLVVVLIKTLLKDSKYKGFEYR